MTPSPANPLDVRAAAGRADLVRAFAAAGPEGMRALALRLGMVEAPTRIPTKRPGPDLPEPSSELPSPEPTPVPKTFAPVPLLRLEKVDHLEDASEETPPDLPPLGQSELLPPPGARPPTPSPIVRWSRLLPALEKALRTQRDSREIDTRRLVERWSRGERVASLPRRSSPHLSTQVTVVLDRSSHLAPFWQDQDHLLERLHRLLGRWGLVVALRRGSGAWSFGRRGPLRSRLEVPPGERVLAVSDLGMYAPWGDPEVWKDLARQLGRQGAAIHALVPCPASRWRHGAARAWRAIDWSSPLSGSRPVEPAVEDRTRQRRARLLLRLVAPALYVTPGLLRETRRLLGPRADIGTEADVWNHPDFAGSSSLAGIVQPEKLGSERRAFARLPRVWRAQALRAIQRWRQGVPADVWSEELVLAELSGALPEGVVPEAELARQRRLLLRLARTVAEPASASSAFSTVLTGRFERLMARAPEAWQEDPEMAGVFRRAWAALAKDRPDLQLLPGMPPSPSAGVGSRLEWPVWQVGAGFELRPEGETPIPGRVGCLLLRVSTAGNEIVAAAPRQWGKRAPLQPGQSGPLSVESGLVLITERQRLHLRPFDRPRWARAMGRDRVGLWVEIQVGTVRHRLRWIPPGRFWMGSPEGEEGRWQDEGPRHLVTLTQGYWLGETPCTQALWQAVMGENPSRFQTLDRPVEQVSWEDCQSFLAALNERVPGLGARLPTEAEWEHACRAGTETSTYAGELEILGAANAPLLDGIAWYAGNSGEGFELENGWDSSDWPEQQYPNARSGTRPVGWKNPNAWGLYDMLGNVWEWCEDRWSSSYDPEPAVDPRGPSMGSGRVIRGGSWYRYARYVRAAARYGDAPEYRDVSLGFRLARGQEAALGEQEEQVGGAAGEPVTSVGAEPRRVHRSGDAPAGRPSRRVAP